MGRPEQGEMTVGSLRTAEPVFPLPDPGLFLGTAHPHTDPKYILPSPMESSLAAGHGAGACGRPAWENALLCGREQRGLSRKHPAGFGKGVVGPVREKHIRDVLKRGARPDRHPVPGGRKHEMAGSPLPQPDQGCGITRETPDLPGCGPGAPGQPDAGAGPPGAQRTCPPGRELSRRRRSVFKPPF